MKKSSSMRGAAGVGMQRGSVKTPLSAAFSRVHVVVAPNHGERLCDLPECEAAWVAYTPENHRVIKRLWEAAGGARSHLEAATLFQVASSESPEDWLLGVMPDIDLHHGGHSQVPAYSELRVIGAALNERLRADLGHYGFDTFNETVDGFVARKSSG
jgi:hypothetical protein